MKSEINLYSESSDGDFEAGFEVDDDDNFSQEPSSINRRGPKQGNPTSKSKSRSRSSTTSGNKFP